MLATNPMYQSTNVPISTYLDCLNEQYALIEVKLSLGPLHAPDAEREQYCQVDRGHDDEPLADAFNLVLLVLEEQDVLSHQVPVVSLVAACQHALLFAV